MGIHPWHPPEPRQESGVNQVGRPVWGHLQVLEIGGCGSAVGKKEEQQQHDLRKTQPSDEVRSFQSQPWPVVSSAVWVWPATSCDVLCYRYYYKREILERVDGRRLVYKFGKNARGWRENENWICQHLELKPTHTPDNSKPRNPAHAYFKDYFSLIFMYHEGEQHPLLMGRRNTTVDKIILLLWSMSYMGNKRTQFSVKYDACMWPWFIFASIEVLFHCKKNRIGSLVLPAKRKKKILEGIKCFYVQND